MVQSTVGDLVVKEVVGSQVTLQALIKNLPAPTSDCDNLAAWSTYAMTSADVFGDKTTVIRYLHDNTTTYEKEKRNTATRFFVNLANNANFASLCEVVDEDEGPNKKVIRFIKLLRGNKTEEKKTVLNAAMVVYLANHRKQGFEEGDAEGVYQPNTFDTTLKILFRFFKQSGVCIEQSNLRGMPGSFHAVLKELYARTQIARPEDYGRLPNKASSEPNDEYKLRNCANPPLRPFENPLDLVELTLYKTGRDITLREKEVRLEAVAQSCSVAYYSRRTLCLQLNNVRKTDWEEGIVPDGILKGRPFLSYKGSAEDRTLKLSTKNTAIREDNGLQRIVEDPDDPYSTYKLIKYLWKHHLPEGWTGFMFLRPASVKTMDTRKETGATFTADIGKRGKYGKNQPSAIFKRLAHRCGFENPDRFTGRGARRTGLSNSVKGGTDYMTNMAKGRHSGVAVHSAYMDVDTEKQQVALQSLHYGPMLNKEKAEKKKSAKKKKKKRKAYKKKKIDKKKAAKQWHGTFADVFFV